ncbi:hypothetical protein CJJ19_11145 (plasmid) [Candidatus Williamhamiltonella defendens]|nr:hypothetical protein CJJ19_11145 [Candidatus Hamiltonella defensa]
MIAKAAAHHEELFSCIHKSIFDREVKLLNNEKFKTPLINEKVIFIPEETVDQLLPIDFMCPQILRIELKDISQHMQKKLINRLVTSLIIKLMKKKV